MVKLRKIDIMLLRMIKHSKGQFIAVLVIVIVGISVFTSMNMTSVNMRSTVESYYQENNFPDLFIKTGSVPESEVEHLVQLDGIKESKGRISIDIPMISDDLNENIKLRLITLTGEKDELSCLTMLEGRTASGKENEAVLIDQFAEARGIRVGDSIKIQVKGIQNSLEIVGIAANPEYIYLMENPQAFVSDYKKFGVAYISQELGQLLAGYPGSFNEVIIKYENGTDEEIIENQIKEILDNYGPSQITQRENQLSNAIIQEELKNLDAMANSLPILFLLVAALILVMMIGRMVKKDRVKIGLLKAMGFRSREVLFHYVKYALIEGILGGFCGAALGMAIAGAMTRLYLEYFNIPLLRINFYFSYVITAVILSALFCCIAGVVGARKILRISPADSMRSEAPKPGKRICVEKIRFIWKRLSFSHKLVAKNIFRNKKRTAFVLMGVVLTYAMMLFTVTMPQIMDQMMNDHFLEFQKMDYNIDFRKPVKKSSINDMFDIVDVEFIEGKLEYPFELSNGNKSKTANIIGINNDSRFYSFKDINDEPVSLQSNGIMLSENLAKALEVDKGDNIQIHSFIPNRDDILIQVKGVIKQTLGINGYMSMDEMGKLLLEKNVVTGVYMDSSDTDINKKLIYASNIISIMTTADMRALYDEYMQMVILSIGFMILFSGILGFSIVYNATLVSVSEREMEFSSLRILGFSKKEIFAMILKENNIIMILGIILGIPVGKIFANYSSSAFSTDLYTLNMDPTPLAAVLASLFTVAAILLAQLATYRKINRIDFLQALKNREG